MNPRNPTLMIIASLLLAVSLSAAAVEEVIIQEHPVDRQTDQGVADQPPLVQDLGAGTTDDGGVPDATVDLRDAAIEDEQNLGPNAPGYIP